MITTGIDVDESVHDPAVELNWTYVPSGMVIRCLIGKRHTTDHAHKGVILRPQPL